MEEEPINLDCLVLKDLPTDLHYTFLGENGTKPMIISTALKMRWRRISCLY